MADATPSLPFASVALSAALSAHAARIKALGYRGLLAADPNRYAPLSVEAEGLLLDFSRQLIDPKALKDLLALAEASQVSEAFERMCRGDRINASEQRAVLHTALRDQSGTALVVAGEDIRALVRQVRDHMRRFVAAVTQGERRGATGSRFTDVIHIGIGGSDLGPVMVVDALKSYTNPALAVHFVSNVDGVQWADVSARLNPATTLVVICSKTFTTLETLTNAKLARAWIVAHLGETAVAAHFAAVSVNHAAMNAFGVADEARFALWDWVGGRYSVWSAIGLTVELAIGSAHFEALLKGAYAMDCHARTAPFGQNLPVLMGLLAVWNRHYLAMTSHAVLPYDQRLHRFPAYLQQLAMESNGKRVRREGSPVDYPTEAVLWGEAGSNGQHSFFQLLHQGTACVSIDLLLPARSSVGLQASQDLAIAHALAQAEAFAMGYTEAEAWAELRAKGVSMEQAHALAPHKVHPGNRPSSLLLCERLDPSTLGRLVALYEHRVFVESVLWDINAFDQWGVELGKRLADALAPAVTGAGPAPSGLQPLMDRLARWRR